MIPTGQKLMATQNRLCAAIEDDENFQPFFRNDGELSMCDLKYADHSSGKRRYWFFNETLESILNSEKTIESASRRAKLEFTIDYESKEDATNTYKELIEELPGWF